METQSNATKLRIAALVLVLLSASLASRYLLQPGHFHVHDDFQFMRQLQMEKCWQDGQIPCRWVPDMGYGYGYPLFNFYPPLPCYIGQLFRWLGFSFIDTQKLTFALGLFLSGIAMFVLASDLWGTWGGLLSAILYLWAPYYAVDVYVRGAINEAWSFVWYPLICWSSKKLLTEEKPVFVIWLAATVAGLLLTHNLMVIAFAPLAVIWACYWMAVLGKYPWKRPDLLVKFFIAGSWALGLAAFFTLPMLAEQKFIHMGMIYGFFEPRKHFASLTQLFLSRFWGYGGSNWGYNDGMSFQIGQVHWGLAALISVLMTFHLCREFIATRRINLKREDVTLIVFLLTVGLFYAFLIHPRSLPIWKIITILHKMQFPWRFLAQVTFAFSLLGGAIWSLTKNRLIVLMIALLAVIMHWGYFRPEYVQLWVTDADLFSGSSWDNLRGMAVEDYLPKSAMVLPTSPPENEWSFLGGDVEKADCKKGTNWLIWKGDVKDAGKLQVSIFYFPGWKAWIDGNPIDVSYEKELGRMQVFVPAGEHTVYFRLVDTPIRRWANIISLISWSALLLVVIRSAIVGIL